MQSSVALDQIFNISFPQLFLCLSYSAYRISHQLIYCEGTKVIDKYYDLWLNTFF